MRLYKKIITRNASVWLYRISNSQKILKSPSFLFEMMILFCDSITVLTDSLYDKHDKFRRDFPVASQNLLTQRWTESKFSKFCLLSSGNQQSFVQKQKIIMANESQILFLKVSCHRKPNKIKETLNNYAKSIGKVSQIGIINVKTVHEGNLLKNSFSI